MLGALWEEASRATEVECSTRHRASSDCHALGAPVHLLMAWPGAPLPNEVRCRDAACRGPGLSPNCQTPHVFLCCRKRSSVYELHTGTPQPPAVTERTVTQCFPHSSSNSESNSSQLRDIQSVTAHEEPHRGPRHCALEFLKADLLLPEISKPLPLSCNFSPPRAMTTLTAIGQHLRFSQDRICVLESKVCDT